MGGGIFGVTIGLKLSQNHQVEIFEKNDDIFKAASGINQYRLHRGYHYPRSFETAISAKKATENFEKEYSKSIIKNVEHYYCISKRDSLTSAEQYLRFCKKVGLEYTFSNLDLINDSKVELCLKVKENLIDPIKLKQECWERLRKNKVKVHKGVQATNEALSDYDFAIICTYSNLNYFLQNESSHQREYQFEVCEKPVVKLPKNFTDKSVVIMDGPFMCIDPFGKTGLYVLGNVVHGIHQTNIGKFPKVDEKFIPLLNNGVIKNPEITNYESFIKSASEFFPEIKDASHIGSMFTIRTVLPNVEKTDERPTIISPINDKKIVVFSGKISNCVDAAEKITSSIN